MDTSFTDYKAQDVEEKDYSKSYPKGLNLHPDSALHQEILTRLMASARDSLTKMSSRYCTWRAIDRNLSAYVPKDSYELAVEQKDFRKPTSIVIPMSFAIREALLTYLSQVLLGKIYFPFTGVGPEDAAGAILMQHLLQQQCLHSKAELAFLTQWSDSLTYGIGICAPVWERQYGNVRVSQTQFDYVNGIPVPSGVTSSVEQGLIWEGNKFCTIDPYSFLPDPNVSIDKIQEGEFVGWVETTNRLSLLERERSGAEGLFNCRFLDKVNNRSVLKADNSGREDRNSNGSVRTFNTQTTNPVDIHIQYRNLIPAEWGLGKGEYPEKWIFIVANDKLIIKCAKLDLAHNLYPISVCAPDYDGYTISPISRMELIYGEQKTMDWLVSSHIANVRKTVNNNYIINPRIVEEEDVKRIIKEPGGYVRIKSQAFGRSLEEGITQLKTSDITRQNIGDAGYLAQMMERVASAPGAMQGIFDSNAPERRTATEYSGTSGNAQARLAKIARVIYAMSVRDLAYMAASNTQQFMTQDTYVQIAGELIDTLSKEFNYETSQGRVKISPKDININYDLAPIDGSIPSEQDGKLALELFQIASANPNLGINLQKYFVSLARRFGEKNIENYLLMPDEQVQQQAMQGNLQAI